MKARNEYRAKQSRKWRREQYWRSVWYDGHPAAWWMGFAEKLFGGLVGLRRFFYRKGLFPVRRLPVPVIVVGNITAGGTGKTPFVIWLVHELKERGFRPGVVSRGYGGVRKVEPMQVTPNSNPNASGDEALLIARRTGVPVMVGKRRATAAKKLLAGHPINVIVADDGLQHYALGRDVEIALIDGRLGLGNGRLLPAGPLREPQSRLRSVDMVLCKGACDDDHCFEPILGDAWSLAQPSKKKSLSEFIGQPVHALAGIAQPGHFFRLLAAQGVAAFKHPLPDHHVLVPQDFELAGDYPILITEKDAVKCQDLAGNWKQRVWVVPMDLHVPEETRSFLWDCLNDKAGLRVSHVATKRRKEVI